MADRVVQNQLNFNLNVPLAASKLAVRYHKPNPIIVERAGGFMPMNLQPNEHVQHEGHPANTSQSSAMDEKMALAVQLAKRDLKRQKEKFITEPSNKNKSSAPKHVGSKFSKAGTRIIQTREARDRAARLEQKRAARDPLKVREQGWNSGTAVTRDKTPPRRTRFDLPATTNSPPTRDTDRYPMSRPSSMPTDNPGQEIERLQKEIENYLQQIQVIEQRAMTDNVAELGPQSKSRKKDGYLSDEEDPARKAIRMEEQAVRVTRQLYNLRQQVRALQDQVTRGDKVKHTKKSQVMLRLAAAHRGAVRAIQSFVNQQLPQQDLKQGLPAGYQELALLIRQLVMISTQIKGNQDTEPIHKDLLRMLDRVDELNKAWCKEKVELSRQENLEEGRHQVTTIVSSQPVFKEPRGRPVGKKRLGKENKPKGLLKKHIYKGSVRPNSQPTAKHRQVTPERQGVLRAGLEALLREKVQSTRDCDDRTPNFSMNETDLSEPAERSLILSKPLQQKRAMAQKGVSLAVPETHYADPTLASSLKTVQQEDVDLNVSSQEPWRPGGSIGRSPSRSRSKERSRSYERNRSRERIRSLEKYRSHSPQSYRQAADQHLDTELMLELFPHGVDGQSRRGRSRSPRSRSQRQRSRSPPRNMPAERLRSNLKRMHQGVQDAAMSSERQRDLSEIHMRQLLADRAIEKAEVDGDKISDMILNDILYDTVREVQCMEDDTRVSHRAAAALQNPTLENLYQRLEEMELEQQEIRRRWGSFQFEEESSRKRVVAQQPAGPVAMEITKHGPSQSVKVQDTRSFHKETDAPIIFTKTAPPVNAYEHTVYPLTEDGTRFEPCIASINRRGQEKFKLRIPETVVKSIKRNVDTYERHLRKTSHASQGKFDPWRLVEEISDQILDECLHEIDKELDDIGENIVHQVCKSEFALPEPQPSHPAELASELLDNVIEDYGNDYQFESSNQKDKRFELTYQNDRKFEMTNQNLEFQIQIEEEVYLGELPSPIYEDDRPSFFAAVNDEKEIDKEKSKSEVKSSNGERTGTSQKKEVSFSHEIGYERETIFDAADLDTARDIPEQEDDEYDDEDDDDDDDVEEVSPFDDSDDLEYSTDEA